MLSDERANLRIPYELETVVDDTINKLPYHYKSKSDFIRVAIIRELKRIKLICKNEPLNYDVDILCKLCGVVVNEQ